MCNKVVHLLVIRISVFTIFVFYCETMSQYRSMVINVHAINNDTKIQLNCVV